MLNKEQRKAFVLALIIISFFALAFGYWFALHQLYAVASDAPQTYPLSFFLITILRCYLTIIAVFCCSCLTLQYLANHHISSIVCAFTFAPLLMLFLNASLFSVTLIIIILQLLFLITALHNQNFYQLILKFKAELSAFSVLLLLHFFISTQFSPLHWGMAMFTSNGFVGEEIPVVAPLFKGYALAKQFVFSSFDHTEWAGILNPPITLNSPFLQSLTLVFDLPSMSPEAYHAVLSAINFLLIIMGSFGFYLFLTYALNLHFIFSLLGACLFFFSGAPYLLNMLGNDGGVFVSSYAVFPYALLFITLAFQNKSNLFSWAVGIALSSQFFLLTPHPEGTIYSFLFYSIYLCGLILFTRDMPLRNRLALGGISILSTLLLSSFAIVPILYDELVGNMHTFAHIGDIHVIDMAAFADYIKLLKIFLPLSFLSLFFVRQISAAYLSMVFYTLVLLAIIFGTSHIEFIMYLLKKLHIGLHFWVPWRLGMFFCIGIYSISMLAFDAVAKCIILLASKRFLSFVKTPVYEN